MRKRLNLLRLSLVALILPAAAFAQVTVIEQPKLVDRFLTPSGIATALGLILSAVFYFLKLGDDRKRQLAIVAERAFQMVNDLAATTPGEDALDKVAAGLKAADDYAKANGWRTLREDEKQVVEMTFKALHGAEKQAVAVQAEAAKVAVSP
jgi:hypothetical protein